MSDKGAVSDKGDSWAKHNAVPADEAWAEANAAAAVPVREHVRSKPGFLKQLARSQAKNLPAIGAAVGAAIGSPALAAGQVEVPVGLAMLGGALGKAGEQALAGPLGVEGPSGPLEAITQQANAAAFQGAFQGLPTQYLAPGLKAAGGALARSQMAKALAPAKALVRNFPTVVSDALRQGATVNRWLGRGGFHKAEQVRRDATGKVVGLLRAATSRGEAIPIYAVAAPVIEAVEKKAGKLSVDETGQLLLAVQARADDLLLKSVMGATKRGSALMSPMMADELRKAAARSSRATLTAESMGLPTTAIPDMDRLIAQGAGEAVKMLRGVRAARGAEKAAIGVSRAIRESELRPHQPVAAIGVGPMRAGFGATPGIGSRLALASQYLGNPMIGPILANLLRAGTVLAPGPREIQNY